MISLSPWAIWLLFWRQTHSLLVVVIVAGNDVVVVLISVHFIGVLISSEQPLVQRRS